MADQWVLHKLPVSKITYGHDGLFFTGPDKRGERKDKWGKAPIHVKRSGGGYKVIDGNDRLYYAKQRGDTHIQAYVRGSAPAKKRGWLYWE